MSKNIVAIILARGGSKGIKNKNIMKIKNKPLIYWSIKSCLQSRKIDSVWVSSDNNKILSLSKSFGANIIKRPKQISKDNSKSEKAWLHAIKYLSSRSMNFDTVIGVQPTSPVRPKKVFDSALKQFYKEKLDSLFTGQKISDFFVWTKKNKKFSANYNFKNRPMRQMIKQKFLENGSFYIFNSKKFLKSKCRLFGKIGCFVMDKIYSFQIDNLEDVRLIQKFTNYIR